MKMLLIAALLATLSACATTQSNLEQQYVQNCIAYEAAYKTVNTLDSQNKLSTAEIQAVIRIDQTVTPLCKTMLADVNASIAQITAATTTLTVQIIADKVSKK